MIESKEDLMLYIKADKKANKFTGCKAHINVIYKYLKRLRITEYYVNSKKNKLIITVSKFLLYRLSVKTGITIGLNCFGKGLYIPHYGYVVCNDTAIFGEYCILQCGVNISEGASGGNRIFFGTGAKIMKNVYVADNTIIGANSVVTKDILEKNCVVAGVPAKHISYDGMTSRNSNI